jgi:ABC-type antimicrobial peptide transport system permease subunit
MVSMMTLERQLEESLITERMIAALSTVFGLLATVLAVLGLYGVMAYTVARRSREIGIRMALGAQREELTRMFVRQGLALAITGVTLGLATAFMTMRLMSSLLFNVSPVDPGTYVGMTAVILAVAWLACYLPSRRAAAVEPVTALRAE